MADPDLQQRLLADRRQFAAPRHARWDPLGLMGVRDGLRERLSALRPLEEHRFGSGSDAGTNLILWLPGRESSRRPLLVGAHDDGPPQSPGADDNASGLVALLELARRWAANPPRRPVWLVGGVRSGGVGNGGQRYPHAAMRAVYGDRGDFIALVANTAAAWLLARCQLRRRPRT